MPAAVYQFNTTLLADIRKCAGDIISFRENVVASGYNITRFDADGRRVTSGTIVFTTNVEVPDYVLFALDVTKTSPTTYELTTRMLIDLVKCTDDLLSLFDNLSGGGIQVVSISIDGRTLTNGQIRVTTNDIASVTAVFGLDVTRVS